MKIGLCISLNVRKLLIVDKIQENSNLCISLNSQQTWSVGMWIRIA